MSATEIISELSKLSRQELEAVDGRLHELLEMPQNRSVWQALTDIAGTAQGLPADLAAQHDHYLHGTPKR
jgi:hypothetical protein